MHCGIHFALLFNPTMHQFLIYFAMLDKPSVGAAFDRFLTVTVCV